MSYITNLAALTALNAACCALVGEIAFKGGVITTPVAVTFAVFCGVEILMAVLAFARPFRRPRG